MTNYHIGIKPVWANAYSVPHCWGYEGMTKNTVTHVVFDEPFEAGRLKRAKGEYLCSQSKGDGKYLPRNNKVFKEITCKKCFKMALRLGIIIA